jgi:deoxyribonuclease-4
VRGGGTLIPCLVEGEAIGATSVQIFTQSPRMWKPSQYSPEVLAAFRAARSEHPGLTHVFAHASYLINLASPDKDLFKKSVDCLAHNVAVGRGMASDGIVLHVGSHMGTGFEARLTQMASGLRKALDIKGAGLRSAPACPILLENAAGQGGTVGRTFEELGAIIEACGGDERLGVCVDTQHLWASGVDYSTVAGAKKFVQHLDRTVGVSRLRCLHLNDSKADFGGNRDRHANLDEGTIGSRGLAPLIGHAKVRGLPLILEVPGDGGGPRAQDIETARAAWTAGVALYKKSSPTKVTRTRR